VGGEKDSDNFAVHIKKNSFKGERGVIAKLYESYLEAYKTNRVEITKFHTIF
jgi:hypothetical protein